MPAKPLPTSPPEPPLAEKPVLGRRESLSTVRKLAVLMDGVKDLRVAVLLDPGKGEMPLPEIVPLGDWPTTSARE
jgi:hypothetical protein